ncbi:hypothetical protein ACGFW5_29170 [Streptomyces sp. NPDC048416]|uniref:hypothetical protein n=1 Tax=Streptomyces sp. NPDC048416 TaxID=3365546 RepID=UPI0037101FBA
MRRRTIVTSTALLVCATTALTACSSSGSGSGSGSAKGAAAATSPTAAAPAAATPSATKGPYADLSGGQIATNALKATRSASSLHVLADIVDAKDGPSKLDVSLNSKGDCTGTLGDGKDALKLIKVGHTAYVKPEKSTGKWTKTNTTSGDGKDLAAACDLNSFFGPLKGEDTVARKGATTTVGGAPAIVLTENDSTGDFTMDVATSGKPYLLKMVSSGGDSPGTVAFSDFGRPVHAVAPPKSQVAAG